MQLHRILNELEPILGKNLQITRHSTALTNAIYQIKTQNSQWALRCNNPDAQSLGIDRNRETAILRSLQPALFIPIIDSINESYLLTRWIDGNHLRINSVSDLNKLIPLVNRVHTYQMESIEQTSPLNIRTQLSILSNEIRLSTDIELRLKELKEQYQPTGKLCLCHHDWHSGNVIEADQQLILIDWEYAALGDPVIDWACVFSGFNVPDNLKQRLLEAAELEASTFNLALALVEMMSLLWFHRRFPETNWSQQYSLWLQKWRILN